MDDREVFERLCDLAEEAYEVADNSGWHDRDVSCEQCVATAIEEVGELVKADRSDHRAWDCPSGEDFTEVDAKNYAEKCQNTVESELADIVLRCFDIITRQGGEFLFGNGFEHTYRNRRQEMEKMSIPELVLFIAQHIVSRNALKLTKSLSASRAIGAIVAWCDANDIDILWHIKAKIEYNKTRPYRHGGKRY